MNPESVSYDVFKTILDSFKESIATQFDALNENFTRLEKSHKELSKKFETFSDEQKKETAAIKATLSQKGSFINWLKSNWFWIIVMLSMCGFLLKETIAYLIYLDHNDKSHPIVRISTK